MPSWSRCRQVHGSRLRTGPGRCSCRVALPNEHSPGHGTPLWGWSPLPRGGQWAPSSWRRLSANRRSWSARVKGTGSAWWYWQPKAASLWPLLFRVAVEPGANSCGGFSSAIAESRHYCLSGPGQRTRDGSIPIERDARVRQPTLVLNGGNGAPFASPSSATAISHPIRRVIVGRAWAVQRQRHEGAVPTRAVVAERTARPESGAGVERPRRGKCRHGPRLKTHAAKAAIAGDAY